MDHHQSTKQTAWDTQNSVYKDLLRLNIESPVEVFGEDKLISAFADQPKIVKCIDERVVIDGQPTIALAGSGVLLSDDQLKITADLLKKAGVNEITYHQGCGACSLVCQQHKDKVLDPTDVAKESAEKLSSALNLPNSPKYSSYTPNSDYQMIGDSHFHHARAIVVDGTGRLNLGAIDLPAAFLISPKYHPDMDYTKQELDIAINIALGDHGFGRQKFEEESLLVVLAGSPMDREFSPDQLKWRLKPIIDQYPETVELVTLPVTIGTEELV